MVILHTCIRPPDVEGARRPARSATARLLANWRWCEGWPEGGGIVCNLDYYGYILGVWLRRRTRPAIRLTACREICITNPLSGIYALVLRFRGRETGPDGDDDIEMLQKGLERRSYARKPLVCREVASSSCPLLGLPLFTDNRPLSINRRCTKGFGIVPSF